MFPYNRASVTPPRSRPGGEQGSAASDDDKNVNLQELQTTVSRLSAHKGVQAVLILNQQGDILAQASSTTSAAASNSGSAAEDNSQSGAALLARHVTHVLQAAQALVAFQEDSPSRSGGTGGGGDKDDNSSSSSNNDQVSMVQIRTLHNHEIHVAPHQGYVLAVLKK